MTTYAETNSVNMQTQNNRQPDPLGTLITDAQLMGLATHPTWLRLHYYKNNNSSATPSYHSDIDNPNFFLSSTGQDNPKAEIEAFIRTITKGNDMSNSTICQFPARTHWVTSQLSMNDAVEGSYLKNANCPELDKWMEALDPQRLSVVFAGEYPDTPVSAFGHTLMLIDSTASLADPAAIDKAYALNDTVGGNPDDAFLTYAYKSATGGYPNDITIDPYPEKLADYLQRDNRDVWTYSLKLTDAEVQQIMRHVWESKGLELPYYFTLDNCASEILRYIDIVRPEGSLLEQFKFAVIPADVVRLLANEGLIASSTYLPADKTLAQAKINNPQLTNLPTSTISRNHTLNMTDLVPVDNDPLTAHPLQRAKLGVGQQGDTGYFELGYQFGFNDWLARPDGYPQNFNMTTLSAILRVYEDSNKGYDNIELEEATLLQGRSFNPINTAYKGGSWGVDIGAKHVKDGSVNIYGTADRDQSHLVGNLIYEKGVSYSFGEAIPNSGQLPPHLCYALGAGQVQVGKGLSNGYRVGVSANLGCRYQISGKARLIGEVKLPYWYHGDIHSDTGLSQITDSYWQPTLSIGTQYDIDHKQAVRLEGSYQFQDRVQDKKDIQLSYVRYF